MKDLKMVYPNVPEHHRFNARRKSLLTNPPERFSVVGNIRKATDMAGDAFHSTYVNNHDINFITDEFGRVVEYTEYNGPLNACTQETIQELKNLDDVQFKTTTVQPLQGGRESYTSIQRLDKENGLYSVVRKKGDKVIGGYEANLRQDGRKFATGFKGRLEKLALNIAQDSNGCERKGLRKIGDLLFKIAQKIR